MTRYYRQIEPYSEHHDLEYYKHEDNIFYQWEPRLHQWKKMYSVDGALLELDIQLKRYVEEITEKEALWGIFQ